MAESDQGGACRGFTRSAFDAKQTKAAGFDRVEVHGANGYLLDQFLHDGSNKCTDQCGGSIEDRARLLLEVMQAVAAVWSTDRIGVRLSSYGTWCVTF